MAIGDRVKKRVKKSVGRAKKITKASMPGAGQKRRTSRRSTRRKGYQVAHMSTLNDAKFQALRDQGFVGTITDMTLQWLQLNGATSDSISDAWREMLAIEGFSGQRNDAWFGYLGSLAFTGHHNDRELAFWLGGGIIPP